MKKQFTKLLQKHLKNNSPVPIKYWLYQQTPYWFRNIVWKYDDLKYDIKSWIKDRFCWYDDWVEGHVRAKDETGVWIGWSDDDTFIPATKKKWVKLFKDINEGENFICHFWWGILKDEVLRIKDVIRVKDPTLQNFIYKKAKENMDSIKNTTLYKITVGKYIQVLYPVFKDENECYGYSELAYIHRVPLHVLKGKNINHIKNLLDPLK